MKKEKPTFDEVYKYAENFINQYIMQYGSRLPQEQQEEVRQEAFIRILKAYERLESNKGWKSFIQWHCKGGVKDYIRRGDGFQESKWASYESKAKKIKYPDYIHKRTIIKDSNKNQLSVEECAAYFGVFAGYNKEEKPFDPNWDLLARLSNLDEDVHLASKVLLGFTLTELADFFGTYREMLVKRYYELLRRFNNPDYYNDRWIKQLIYAFGLSEKFKMKAEDLGIGWGIEPVDLYSRKPLRYKNGKIQMSFAFAV